MDYSAVHPCHDYSGEVMDYSAYEALSPDQRLCAFFACPLIVVPRMAEHMISTSPSQVHHMATHHPLPTTQQPSCTPTVKRRTCMPNHNANPRAPHRAAVRACGHAHILTLGHNCSPTYRCMRTCTHTHKQEHARVWPTLIGAKQTQTGAWVSLTMGIDAVPSANTSM